MKAVATKHLRKRRVQAKQRAILANVKEEEWTPEKFKAFADEIDSIRENVTPTLGKEDVDYIKQVKRASRFSEIMGRFLIHFSIDPLTWSAGTCSLWIHKQLETAEIGHSALHG